VFIAPKTAAPTIGASAADAAAIAANASCGEMKIEARQEVRTTADPLVIFGYANPTRSHAAT
jgi:hypothetical protein